MFSNFLNRITGKKEDGRDRVPLSDVSDETMVKMSLLTGNISGLKTHLRGGAIRIISGRESVLIRFGDDDKPIVEKERWIKVSDSGFASEN